MIQTRLASENRTRCTTFGHGDREAVAVRTVQYKTGLGATYTYRECPDCARKALKDNAAVRETRRKLGR